MDRLTPFPTNKNTVHINGLCTGTNTMSDMTCVKQSDHLLTTSTTYVAGYRCESVALYWSTCALAIALQIGSNYIYVKSSQATREALHEGDAKDRMQYVWKLVGFTLISMAIYIVNILLILGANIGVLISVLIGNIIGTVVSVLSEKADKARTAIEIVTMIKEYKSLDGKDKAERTNDEKNHLEMIEKAREELNMFLSINNDVKIQENITSVVSPVEDTIDSFTF